MKKSEFLAECDQIISFGLIDILSFNELEDMPEIADRFYAILLDIFRIISRLKRDKVYNQREISAVFYLLKDNIYSVSDLLLDVNLPALPALIYEVVYNIFEELFVLCEDTESFETAQNLLNFRDMWFQTVKVKIINVKSGQK